MSAPKIKRLAAFASGGSGGNPAGVMLSRELPSPPEMQTIATEVGYSETAFAASQGDTWRVRYFAPQMEVPFCGHATIALGAALAMAHGDETYPLQLNDTEITVRGWRDGPHYRAALNSPPTRSGPAEPGLVEDALALFGYTHDDLDQRIPPALTHAGADHLLIALRDRAALAAMTYNQPRGKRLMQQAGLITVNLVHAENDRVFHARNPFAAGGVYEDPATGAAAAAFAGYLRDLRWPHGGNFTITQGADMGAPSAIEVRLDNIEGTSVEVSGSVRTITP